MPYVDEVLADAPVAYYRFAEASGFPQDSSGNGNHVTGGSGPLQGVGGALSEEVNAANRFDGLDDLWTIPSNATLDVGDTFSLEVWIKRNSLNALDETILSKDTNGFAFRLGPITPHRFSFGKEFVAWIVTSTVSILDENWHHLVVTKSGTTTKLYQDSFDVTGTVTNQTIANTATPLRIGLHPNGLPGDMAMDELAIYPTALSAARVLAHFLAARPKEFRYSYAGFPK